MTFINKHHVVSDEVTQLLYIDINNLYGWALSQKLPCGEFRWLDTQEEMDEALRKCQSNLDGDIGYTLEVDIEIPDYLHDFLDDLPVAPFSECPPNGSKVKKLLMTHLKKFNYVVHGKLLNFWMNLGVIVSRVHRVVEFKQALLFADYIKNNADKRAASTNDFDKEFYKFKNNSLYGKLIENLKKRRNLRLCNNSKSLVTYSSSALFNRSIKIADDLVAALLQKEFICLDKPSYIGQSVLDLSKLRMYQLQYVDLQWYRDELNCEINVVAGDTDSFFLECKNVDLRTQLLPLLISDGLLDTSNYPETDPLYSLDEAGVIGRFKDESKGFPFHEWYFLRPKCYSLLGGFKAHVLRAKGIHLKGTGLRHEEYKKVYDERLQLAVEQTRIGTTNHQLFTFKTTKRALQCFDDKRYWTGPNSSLAYGHCQLRGALPAPPLTPPRERTVVLFTPSV